VPVELEAVLAGKLDRRGQTRARLGIGALVELNASGEVWHPADRLDEPVLRRERRCRVEVVRPGRPLLDLRLGESGETAGTHREVAGPLGPFERSLGPQGRRLAVRGCPGEECDVTVRAPEL
jgi:hypothetical protein